MKLHLDPRTKLFLILLCVLCAMFSPSLYFQFALVSLIALLALVSGKPLYALRGIAVYAVICAFTVWCMGVMSGTWRTMFVAFLGLVHKVYACGMLSGIVIATADDTRGLALHQGRHETARRISDRFGISESSCNDGELHLRSNSDSGKQSGG